MYVGGADDVKENYFPGSSSNLSLVCYVVWMEGVRVGGWNRCEEGRRKKHEGRSWWEAG